MDEVSDALTELKDKLRDLSGLLCLATRHANVTVTQEALAQECENALAAIHKVRKAQLFQNGVH